MKYHKIVNTTETSPGHGPTHKLTHTVTKGLDGQVLVEVFGNQLNSTTTSALSVLDKLPKKTSLKRIVQIVDGFNQCPGNAEYTNLADKNGMFTNLKRQLIAEVQDGTVRHISCEILVKKPGRCEVCAVYRKSLIVKKNRQDKRQTGEPLTSYTQQMQTV